MRVILVATLALLAVYGAVADNVEADSDADVDTEAEADAPLLPGVGSPCMPVKRLPPWERKLAPWADDGSKATKYDGVCTKDSDCPAERQVIGHCAGMQAVCCRTAPAAAASSSAAPTSAPHAKVVLQSTGGPDLSRLIKIPAGINRGLTGPSVSFQTSKLGSPGCPMTTACFSCACKATNKRVLNNLTTKQVTPTVKVTALKPFVEAVGRALAAAKAAGGQALVAYNAVKTAGAFCCRPIKLANGRAGRGYSNHSWGLAVDLYFGKNVDPRGDGKTQEGLAILAPFFAKERIFWAAGYGGQSEDAMHFEASVQLVTEWTNKHLI